MLHYALEGFLVVYNIISVIERRNVDKSILFSLFVSMLGILDFRYLDVFILPVIYVIVMHKVSKIVCFTDDDSVNVFVQVVTLWIISLLFLVAKSFLVFVVLEYMIFYHYVSTSSIIQNLIKSGEHHRNMLDVLPMYSICCVVIVVVSCVKIAMVYIQDSEYTSFLLDKHVISYMLRNNIDSLFRFYMVYVYNLYMTCIINVR